jgi:hypothetical protein
MRVYCTGFPGSKRADLRSRKMEGTTESEATLSHSITWISQAGIPAPRLRETSTTKKEQPRIMFGLHSLLGLFSRDIGIDLGTANTLVHGSAIAASSSVSRASSRWRPRPRRSWRSAPRPSAWSADSGEHHRRSTPARRSHQRLRRHPADDRLLRAQGSRPDRHGAAAAHAARHPVRRDRSREARRARCGDERRSPLGRLDRGADGRRDRRRPADQRADGQHDRRHRRRHHGSRGHQPRRHRRQPQHPGRRRRDGHRHRRPTPGASTTCSWASEPPRTSRSPSAPPLRASGTPSA